MATIWICETWLVISISGNMHYVVVCNFHKWHSLNFISDLSKTDTAVLCHAPLFHFGDSHSPQVWQVLLHRVRCLFAIHLDGELPSHEPHLNVLWIFRFSWLDHGEFGSLWTMHLTWCDLEIWLCEELMNFGVCPFECLVIWYFSAIWVELRWLWLWRLLL